MERKITVALAGNPNAGKTTIFNALTGARQHVGNWPGVTVEKKEGTVKYEDREIHVVDLPGTYSLTAFSLEEIIARNFIVDSAPDLVVNVVDASNLERNLYLSIQLMEMGCKLVLALNMIDVAKGRGINIDEELFTDLMGVPVIPTNGKKGLGLDDLVKAIVSEVDKPHSPQDQERLTYGSEVEEELCKIESVLSPNFTTPGGMNSRWLSVKLLEGDTEITKKIDNLEQRTKIIEQVEKSRKHLNNIFGDSPEIVLADARYGFISGAIKQTVKVERTNRVNLSESIDKVLTNRLLGPVMLLLVLYSVYIFTFNGSAPLVKSFDSFFSWSGDIISSILPEGLLKSLIVSGIIKGVGGVLGFTPLIAFMFFAIAILEDTGYMARIAFMLDRVLRGFGLHGASMLALMVAGGIAGGCAVPGIMATRTMKEPKERLVTILVAPLMNCGAKLPVYALLIGAFFPGNRAAIMFLLTIISWIMVLLAGRVIRSTVLSGPSAPFVLELPPYRVPTLRGLFIHTWERTWMYLKKAGTVILAVSILIWALMTFPGLSPEQSEIFEQRQAKLTSDFLNDPNVNSVLESKDSLKDLEKFQSAFGGDSAKAVAQFIRSKDIPSDRIEAFATKYAKYSKDKLQIDNEEQSAKLKNTVAGRVGSFLVWVFKPIGFD
ncbi:MAG: ferrous iron transport protein B [Desulfomonilaceae bacterium]